MQVHCIAKGLLLLLLLLLAQAAGGDQPGNHSFLPLIRRTRAISLLLFMSSPLQNYMEETRSHAPCCNLAHLCSHTLRPFKLPTRPSPEGTYLFILVVFLYFHILYLTQAESI